MDVLRKLEVKGTVFVHVSLELNGSHTNRR